MGITQPNQSQMRMAALGFAVFIFFLLVVNMGRAPPHPHHEGGNGLTLANHFELLQDRLNLAERLTAVEATLKAQGLHQGDPASDPATNTAVDSTLTKLAQVVGGRDGAFVSQRIPGLGIYAVDDLHSDFNRKLALPPMFDNELIKQSELLRISCGSEENSFLLHNTGMQDWVCKNLGEKKVTKAMMHVFNHGCLPKSGSNHRGLMLDVGANTGFYGLLAMRVGCETLFFDLQPVCHRSIQNSIVVNGFSSVGRLFPFGVSSKKESFNLDSASCDGRFPASAYEKQTFDSGSTKATMAPLTEFIGSEQQVLLMKVDTEGAEYKVLMGAMHFFEKNLIRNAIVEVTPGAGFWKNMGITQFEVATCFKEIASYGYTMVSLQDGRVMTGEQAVFQYINTAAFEQSDMWLTLDPPADVLTLFAGLL